MPRSEHQKLKLLYLKDILESRSDADHILTAQMMIDLLAEKGIHAERKSIYSDMECLQQYGLDVIQLRGPGGGYYLAKPADQIRIGDVLRATEGSCMPVACVDDEGKCDLAGCCEARGFWRGMGNAINAYIDRITLADVLEGNVEA